MMRQAGLLALFSFASVFLGAANASAQGDFYRGKEIELYVGTEPGGEYDLLTRLAARHLGKHIPGNPSIVPRNMPGGGGIKMALFLYNVPAKDGTSLGVILNNLPALTAVHDPNVPIDFRKMAWLGTIAPTVETMTVWHTTGVSSFAELGTKEIVAGATGPSSITYLYPTVMNALLGTHFKIVQGYASGNAINLAMEKGEVEARNNTWSSWKATHPQWLADKTIRVLTQAGPPAPDLPGVPSLTQLAKSDDDRQLIELLTSGAHYGRPFATTPGVPPDRVKLLRAAFEAMVKDPEFLADAKKLKIDPEPLNGEALQAYTEKLLSFPERLVPRAKKLLGG